VPAAATAVKELGLTPPPSYMAGKVGRAFAIYACAFAVAGATPFVLLPILTQHLSPRQFGEVTSFLILAALLGNLAGVSAHGFVAVRYFKTESEDRARLITGSLAAVVVAHGLSLAAVAASAPLLVQAFDLPLRYVLLAVPAALFVNLNLVWLAIFQSSDQPMLYFKARLLQGVVEIGLCVVLLLLVQADAGARIHGYLAASAASALLGGFWCLRQRRLGARIERKHLHALLAFGLPLLPHIVAGSAISYLDRLVVSSVLGGHSLGLYMAAMQVGMVMVALIEPLNKALAPWMLEQLARNDAALRRRIVRRTYQLQASLVLLGALVAGASMLLFDKLVGAQFVEARALVPWMAAGFVLQGMYYTVVIYLFFAEQTGRLSVISCSVAALGTVVSYLLTRQLGLTGAGISFVINNALLLALVWYSAAKAVPMPWWRAS
jgi:O-antigen/teichoic acid export membrane protein